LLGPRDADDAEPGTSCRYTSRECKLIGHTPVRLPACDRRVEALSPELLKVIEDDHEALAAFAQGDPEPKKQLYSREEDATLANPLGPPVRGWAHIAPVLEHAAGSLRDGRIAFERVSDYEASELAYTVDIERYSVRVIGRDEELSEIALRVTTIFRRESEEWRVVHRHADPITTPRPHESMLEQGDRLERPSD
jgi:hypothetical protein